MKKRRRILMILIASALAVTVGAGAFLSGSGNGYEKTFSALERLLFETSNVTIHIGTEIKADGVQIMDMDTDVYFVGKDRYNTTSLRGLGGEAETDYSYIVDGISYYSFDDENKTYSKDELFRNYATDSGTFIEDSEDTRSMYKLLRLFADFMAGDVKNRFEWQKNASSDTYTVRIDRKNMPEVMRTLTDITRSRFKSSVLLTNRLTNVRYDDAESAFAAYYREKTGEELDEAVFELYFKNDELREHYRKMRDEMTAHYEAMAKTNDSYIVVDASGKAKVYDSASAYYAGHTYDTAAFMDNPDYFMADFDVDSIVFSATLDEQERIQRAYLSLDIGFTDYNGIRHNLNVYADAAFENYGSTAFEMKNLDGYREYVYDETEYTYIPVSKEVRFNGETYTVEYNERVER